MKKIIHLSDLHLGYPGLDGRLNEIVRNVIFLKEPASDYVVLVTGDHVDNATEFDAYSAPRRSLDLLREAGFVVLSVPGNHDYGTGTLGSARYVEQFKKAFLNDASVVYPKLDLIDGVAFMGLDTMAEELHWYDRLWAQGELGERQLDRLDVVLRDDRVVRAEHRVVYMHHHPFDARPFHQLKDSDELGEVVRNRNVDALLYGHNHEGRVANGKWGIARCYDAGTATYKPGIAPRGVGFHRVIDLNKDPRTDYDGQFLPPGLRNGQATTPAAITEAVATEASVNPSAAAMHVAGAIKQTGTP